MYNLEKYFLQCSSNTHCDVFLMSQAQKTQKPPQKPAPALATAVPMLKDPLVKKAELKPKPETTGSFQAFKRTEVKVSVHTSRNNRSGLSNSRAHNYQFVTSKSSYKEIIKGIHID